MELRKYEMKYRNTQTTAVNVNIKPSQKEGFIRLTKAKSHFIFFLNLDEEPVLY